MRKRRLRALKSCAIALILKRLGGESIEVLEESVTIGLAAYELKNILWKEYALGGSIHVIPYEGWAIEECV